MDKTQRQHTFHIPVMGTGFTLDTPLKVAKYGISSVISLVDDTLIEDMREYYCRFYGEDYTPITRDTPDCRAERITAYLNLIDKIVKKQVEELRASPFEPNSEITKYFELLPDTSSLKDLYQKMLSTNAPDEKLSLQKQLRDNVKAGSIDVNIMTKLDTVNYSKDGKELPPEFTDALAALRGYAKSTLNSAIVFSAGLNRRLYTYVEEFKDFYADTTGFIKKKIVLKVSDFRSSLTQGKIFAKKGIWISEFRVESGLNCGGHLFATNGHLLGPVLEEFKAKKKELIQNLHEIYSKAIEVKNKMHFPKAHAIRITVQGGIGTTQEDRFLQEHYEVDSTGWGSPFLLVPEVTIVDDKTLNQLAQAGEADIYPSDVSPLGIPFSNLRGSASDVEKERLAQEGHPGSPCPKRHTVSNTEFTDKPICIASRLYQKMKLKQLETLNLDAGAYETKFREIVQKACICHQLGHSVYLKYKMPKNSFKPFPAVCPGPNLAYFSKIMTLKEMVDHIYGRVNMLNSTYRPHMFVRELQLYVDYFKKEVQKAINNPTEKQLEYLVEFRKNLLEGIEYYIKLFTQLMTEVNGQRLKILKELALLKENILSAVSECAQNPAMRPLLAAQTQPTSL